MIITLMLSVLYGLEVWNYLKKHYLADYLKDYEIEGTSSKEPSDIAVDGGVYYENDDVRFAPPVYIQRYMSVVKILETHGSVNKVVELGCSELSFFKYLKNHLDVKEAVFVDIDESILQENRRKVEPLSADFLRKRENPLDVIILCGNAAVPDERLSGADAVIAIELIEHMLPHDLEALPHSVFGVIKPKVVIITTPNQEFNVIFKNEGFRHPDHKFEWTRDQFESWANNVVLRYPEYSVKFWGIGPGPEGTEILGCCSQMAVFSREADSHEDLQKFEGKCFKVIHTVTYPHEPKREVDLKEVISHKANRFINYSVSAYKFFNDDTNEFEIPLEEVMRAVQPEVVSMELLKAVLIDGNRRIKLLEDGLEAVTISFDDGETDEHSSEEEQELTSENINIAGCGDGTDEDWSLDVAENSVNVSSYLTNHHIPPLTLFSSKLPNTGSSNATVYLECDSLNTTESSHHDVERRSDDQFYSWYNESLTSHSLFPVSPALASVQAVPRNCDKFSNLDGLNCSHSDDNGSQQPLVNKTNSCEMSDNIEDSTNNQLDDFVSSSAYCDSDYDSHCMSDSSQRLSNSSCSIPVLSSKERKDFSEEVKEIKVSDTDGNYSDKSCEKSLSDEENRKRENSLLETLHEGPRELVEAIEQDRLGPNPGTSESDQGLSEIDCQSLLRHNFAQSSLPTSSCEQGKKKKLKNNLLFTSPIPFLDRSKNDDCDVGNKDFEIRLLYDINLDSNKNIEEDEESIPEEKIKNVEKASENVNPLSNSTSKHISLEKSPNTSPLTERTPSFLTGEGEDSSKIKAVFKPDMVEPSEFVDDKTNGDCQVVSSSSGGSKEISGQRVLEIERTEESDFAKPNAHSFSLKQSKVPKRSETPVNMNESFHSESEVVFSDIFNIQSCQKLPDSLSSSKFCSSTPQQINRCHSLQHIKEQSDKKLNRFSLCSEKECSLPNDVSKDGHLKLPQLGNSFDELLGLYQEGTSKDDSSQSRAADSGYPNTSERDMDTDLTPEQVDEILSENESSLEEREEEREEERQEQVVIVGPGAPVQFVEHVENGDVANNNRDDEGNNWEQGELEEVHFEQVIVEAGGVEVEAAPAPAPESDSEDEHKFMSACESLEETVQSLDETAQGASSSLEALPSTSTLFSHSTSSTLSSDDNTWLLSVLFEDTPVQHMARGDASSSYPNDSQPDLPDDSEPSEPEFAAEVVVPGDVMGGGEPSQQ